MENYDFHHDFELPPPVLSADTAAFQHPPPSYEDVMGAYQTSIKAGPAVQGYPVTQIPPLAYIDIMPRCISAGNIPGKVAPKFENFSRIIDAANLWLQNNPQVSVWKCESITKRLNAAKDKSLSYELNEMLRHESTFGFVVYIKGLRLWLTKSAGGPTQQLGLKTVVPEAVHIQFPVYGRGLYAPGQVTVAGETHQLSLNIGGALRTHHTFEGLADTITRMRDRLKTDPVPGTILTIETDKVKAFEQFRDDLDPEATCWAEDKNTFRRFTQVLRIFYIKGSPANEEIGFQQFVPEITERPDGLTGGKFENFDALVHRLAGWVQENQDIRIVNIQQYDAQVEKQIRELEVSSDSTDDMSSTYKDQRFARTLRVFYTKSSPVKGIPANFMSCRLFLPVRTGRKSFECMTQTMDRIDAWLRVTGLPIFTVETVELMFNESYPAGADVTKADYATHGASGKTWLTGIRVYFATPYQEPDPSLLPPLKFGKQGSSSCEIL